MPHVRRPLAARLVAPAVAAVTLCLGLFAPGCNRDVEERLGIDEKKGTPQFQLAKLEQPGELERALTTSANEVTRRLGGYRLTQKARYTFVAAEAGTPRKDALDETWLLELDGKGNHHIRHENAHDQGIEAWAVDRTVYVMPRHGRIVRRSPELDEIDRARDEAQGQLAGVFGILGRFAERKDEGQVKVAGRAGRRIKLSLDDSPPKLKDQDTGHAWRRTMKVSALAGEVVVDEESGAPLHAVLDATWVAKRNPTIPVGGDPDGNAAAPTPLGNDEITVTLHVEADAEGIGAIPPIAAPEGSIPAPLRPRPLLEKQQLLEGLVSAPVKPPGPGK